jgi:hypothetical protein
MATRNHKRRRYRAGSCFGPSHLNRLSEEQLLDTRICDLGVRIEGTPLEDRIQRLLDELAMKKIRFRPHFWLSDEWFTPDGVPGLALPFYLAHPRLAELEATQMLEVEGGTETSCMRILRHETGHAIDNAYRLCHRRRWQEVFGRSSEPYPEYYQPKPYSKKYVLHLDAWYAQSHPAEDFAETFAVWLKPRSRWRSQYRDWPALKKLEYVDQLMDEIRDQPRKVRSRQHVDSVRKIRTTLREHYEKKRTHYGVDYPDFYDRDLHRLFSDAPEHARRSSAAAFLRRNRPKLRKAVAQWTGEYQYTIDQVLSEMIARCEQLDLHLNRSEKQVEYDAVIMLTVQTMNFLHGGHHRVAL